MELIHHAKFSRQVAVFISYLDTELLQIQQAVIHVARHKSDEFLLGKMESNPLHMIFHKIVQGPSIFW